MSKVYRKGDELPKDIYEFAFIEGRKVIAPKRHWRHAIDLGKGGGGSLVKDFGYETKVSKNEDS